MNINQFSAQIIEKFAKNFTHEMSEGDVARAIHLLVIHQNAHHIFTDVIEKGDSELLRRAARASLLHCHITFKRPFEDAADEADTLGG